MKNQQENLFYTKMTAESYVVEKSHRLVEQDRNTIYTAQIYIGAAYRMPKTISVKIIRFGKDFVHYSVEIGDLYPDPQWKFYVYLKENDQTIFSIESDDVENGKYIKQFSGLFESGMTSDGYPELVISPEKQYTIVAGYGKVGTEDYIESDPVVLQTRFGFYVYLNEELGWQWAIPYVYDNGWKECVPAIYNNNEWNTSAENEVSDGGES